MKKLTNVSALEFVLALDVVKENVEVFDKLTTIKAQFERKNSSKSDKPTKTQLENEKIKAQILEVLTEEPKTVTQILTENTEVFEGLTNQKISALLKQLVEKGSVEKIVEKRSSKFFIKTVDSTEE